MLIFSDKDTDERVNGKTSSGIVSAVAHMMIWLKCTKLYHSVKSTSKGPKPPDL